MGSNSPYFALTDMYPNLSHTVTTSGRTVPEDSENQHYNDKVVNKSDGSQSLTNKSMILGSILLFVAITVFLHFLGE